MCKCFRICHESQAIASHWVLWIGSEIHESNDAERGEREAGFQESVGTSEKDRILGGVGVVMVVGSIRGVEAEPNTSRVEHLTNGILPDLSLRKCFASPSCEIHLDTTTCVRQRCATADQDNDDNKRHAHGEVYNAAGPASAFEHTRPHEEEQECVPANETSIKSSSGVVYPASGLVAIYGVDDLIHKVVWGVASVGPSSVARPRKWALEGLLEEYHSPSNDRDEVDADHKADIVQGESSASHPPTDLVKSRYSAATVSIAGGELES